MFYKKILFYTPILLISICIYPSEDLGIFLSTCDRENPDILLNYIAMNKVSAQKIQEHIPLTPYLKEGNKVSFQNNCLAKTAYIYGAYPNAYVQPILDHGARFFHTYNSEAQLTHILASLSYDNMLHRMDNYLVTAHFNYEDILAIISHTAANASKKWIEPLIAQLFLTFNNALSKTDVEKAWTLIKKVYPQNFYKSTLTTPKLLEEIQKIEKKDWEFIELAKNAKNNDIPSALAKKILLLQNINARSHHLSDKKTALHYAVINSNEKLVKFLLAFGAHPLIKDNNDKTPEEYSTKYSITKMLVEAANDIQKQKVFC